MEHALILTATVVYVATAFAWPALRVWRRDRVWPIVFAREKSGVQRALGLLLRGVLVAMVGVGVTQALVEPEVLGVSSAPPGVRALGWSLLAVGALVTVVAQWQMGSSWRAGIDDRPTALVTTGIFRWVRNPIFSGFLGFLAGYACLMPAWWSVALWAVAAAGIRLQIVWEEAHLAALHGAAYLEYAARVGRLVPLCGRRRGRAL